MLFLFVLVFSFFIWTVVKALVMYSLSIIGLGDMAQKIITIIIFISVDIDNYHDKCQIFISFKFKARFLLKWK